MIKKNEKQTRTRQLREILDSPKLEFLCEVHNGLSAKIVEEAGFKGMWGSSLAISASLGIRDNNEASWTQVLEVVEFICEVTSTPLLLDGDTGYGNFNNVRRVVKKLVQRGVAGICIEDKLFPKTNSLLRGDRQPLADIDEFSGKIKAAKDAQGDPDFCVVARVEALIAGWGLTEALRRAEAYHEAGADGILIHSSLATPSEVLAFKKEWGERSPVLIVPTKYYSTPTDVFRDAHFSVVIWANMIVRSAVTAMQQTAHQLMGEQSLMSIEDRIAPVGEIFRLQGDDELREAEKRYLPSPAHPVNAVILAASRGEELGPLTQEIPKALIPVGGRPLLYRHVDVLNEIGIKSVTVVRGYRKELIDAPNIRTVDNDEYVSTQELVSLHKGIHGIEGAALISYGDLLYKKFVAEMLLQAEGDFVIAVDSDWTASYERGRYSDFTICDKIYKKELFNQQVSLIKMGPALSRSEITGEWIGLLKLSEHGICVVQKILEGFSKQEEFNGMRMAHLFNTLIEKGHQIQVQYIRGHWLDVDDLRDLSAASTF